MQSSNSRSTQRGKILALLVAARGSEVPLPQIRACAAQYGARICELRRAGFRIPPPRMETVNGQRHTWYRLESGPAAAAVPKSRPTQESPVREELLFPDQPEREHRDDG